MDVSEEWLSWTKSNQRTKIYPIDRGGNMMAALGARVQPQTQPPPRDSTRLSGIPEAVVVDLRRPGVLASPAFAGNDGGGWAVVDAISTIPNPLKDLAFPTVHGVVFAFSFGAGPACRYARIPQPPEVMSCRSSISRPRRM
jgi:hypothetical protein